MNKTLLYIGGSYETYSSSSDWRKNLMARMDDCNIKTYNAADVISVAPHKSTIVTSCRYQNLQKSDVVLLNMDVLDVDIVWEASLAWSKHIPVIGFGEYWCYDRKESIFQTLFPLIFKDVDEACDYILKTYSQCI